MISGLLTAAGIAGSALFAIGVSHQPGAVYDRKGHRIGYAGLTLMALAAIGGLVWHFAG